MITVDSRAGSGPLLPLLLAHRVPAQHGLLPSGDIAFTGRGPNGGDLRIGVEYKNLPDVLSCITSGRLAGTQMPRMHEHFDVHFLLLEGIWRTGLTGVVEVRRGKDWQALRVGGRYYMGADLDGYLLTLTIQGGTRIKHVALQRESVAWLVALYKWWTDKSWEQHSSLQTFDLSGPMAGMTEPPFVRRIAKELPGIGWKLSAAVIARFPSMALMVDATEEEWTEVYRVGKPTAKKIIAAINGYRE